MPWISRRRLLHMEDEISQLMSMVGLVLANQTSTDERIDTLATQIDADVQSLQTAFAQDTADNQALIQALTTAINNSSADDPSDDSKIQAILTQLQTNHENTAAALQKAGVTLPAPSATATQAASS